jgi:hypothetical protein
MSVLDICDELAAGIEPDPTLRDDAMVQPAGVEVDRLYVWPRVVDLVPEGDGSIDRQEFDIRVAWAADRLGEGEPDRGVTETIQARAEQLAAWVRAHRTGSTYRSLRVGFDFEGLRDLDARGFLAVLRGWVFSTEDD